MANAYTYNPAGVIGVSRMEWWEVMGLPARRQGLAAATLGNRLYAIGGKEDGDGARTNVYRGTVVLRGGVTPTTGSWGGGTWVTITGKNLGHGADITNVTLCGVRAESIVSQSSSQVVMIAGPAAQAVKGDVRVFSASYGETVWSNGFTYTIAPASLRICARQR